MDALVVTINRAIGKVFLTIQNQQVRTYFFIQFIEKYPKTNIIFPNDKINFHICIVRYTFLILNISYLQTRVAVSRYEDPVVIYKSITGLDNDYQLDLLFFPIIFVFYQFPQ